MRCPNCQNEDTKVLDSRPVEDGGAIRRRRECEKCEFRFSTYEEIEILGVTVVKKDGSKQMFSKEKLERAIRLPMEKRPHTDGTLRKLLSAIEIDIPRLRDRALESTLITDPVQPAIAR